MTKKQYSETDVEQLLESAARQDRRRMDDAMSERFLSLIRTEAAACTRRRPYKRVAQWAAAAAVVVLGVVAAVLFYPYGEGGEPLAVQVAPAQEQIMQPAPAPEAAAQVAQPVAVAPVVESEPSYDVNWEGDPVNAIAMCGGGTAESVAEEMNCEEDCDEYDAEPQRNLAGVRKMKAASRSAAVTHTPRRAYLNHVDDTLGAGFAPAPQTIYPGRTGHRYGASVSGEYEITACTDTL